MVLTFCVRFVMRKSQRHRVMASGGLFVSNALDGVGGSEGTYADCRR